MYKYVMKQVTNFCCTACERNAGYLDVASRERLLNLAVKYLDVKHQRQLVKTAINCLEQHMRNRGCEISNSDLALDYCRLQLAGERNEVFACLFLDSKRRIIKFEKIFFGTINKAGIYPRVVVQKALAANASAVICTHNHVLRTKRC